MEMAVVEEMQDAEREQSPDREDFIVGSENVRERVAPRDGFLRCSRRILSKRCMMIRKSERGGRKVAYDDEKKIMEKEKRKERERTASRK